MRLAFALLLALAALAAPPLAAETIEGRARVVDGDTIEIGRTTIRINAIDAPEEGQTCEDWRCGAAATSRMAALVAGAAVRCNGLGLDRYDRTLATCFVGSADIGAAMVREGYAWAFVRYSGVYAAEEAAARAERLGVWRYKSTPPWEFRTARWAHPPPATVASTFADADRRQDMRTLVLR